ncbi:aminotransferase class V-fold PLP-dependent enzyme [Algibacter aquimarinus]|uniref:Aminotransferase class V-fold PLP-dependent enzyme n=1 Tax=Algibacter aquimarinus TaxID=1136748 RepID=A0ABP9HPZ0_9FLAO
MTLKNQKHLFEIPEDVAYLNIASQSPAFKKVYEAGLQGLYEKKHPYKLQSSDFFEPVIELKKLFSKLIDADDYNRIATIPSVSYGFATVTNNIVLKENDEILILAEQFPSNFYSWKKLTEKYNASLKVIKATDDASNRTEHWNESILKHINKNTAVIAMGNIHWSNGSLFNLKGISKKAKEHNALLIIDGSQSIGALPFSIKDIKPDALICAGYKWLFGPYGCAYAYFGEYFDNGNPIEENWANRLNSEDLTKLTKYQPKYKPLANRYSVGESGNFIYVKMQIEALKQVIEWTPKAIQDYCKHISSEAVKELINLGCIIEDDKFRTHHLFGIKLPEKLNIDTLKKDLIDKNIFVSFRGNYIRISSHLYNTKNDFKPLISSIAAHL